MRLLVFSDSEPESDTIEFPPFWRANGKLWSEAIIRRRVVQMLRMGVPRNECLLMVPLPPESTQAGKPNFVYIGADDL